jgi:heme exporter protein D
MMINWTADHVEYVLAAYGVAGFVLAALVVRTLRQSAVLKKTLSEMKLTDPGQKDGT